MPENNFTSTDVHKNLISENKELRRKLQESEEIIEAIRTGAVDALTIQGPDGPQIFTIKGADHTYRVLIEEMNEGALTLNKEGIILYSNSHFAALMNIPLELAIGSSFYDFLQTEDHSRFKGLFTQGWLNNSKGEFVMKSTMEKYCLFIFP
jgi:two-component system CheB/CheR fusion protein